MICPDTGTRATSDSDKAESLSKHFQSVSTREEVDSLPNMTEKLCEKQFQNLTISEETVLEKLMQLNVSKSVGPDGVHSTVLKEAAA